MTLAYNYVYSSNISQIGASHIYVRFKPANVFQLNTLDSLDLELYDYPLNRQVNQDGDYWPEAYYGLGDKEYPWLYTVVEKTFNFPLNIQSEFLDSLYIPANNEALEDEAFYISGNSVCDSVNYLTIRQERKLYYQIHPSLVDICILFPEVCGGGGGGGGGGSDNSSLKPKGRINFATYTTNTFSVGASAPLRYVRVVGRRFFKIDKTYTDANGNFNFSKRFPRKVTIIVKFKASTGHGQHSVRVNFINFGIWRSMFPLKKNIGTYKGNNLHNLNYEFRKGDNSLKRKTKQWLAAVIMNTNEEARSFLSENNMIMLPNDLRLYLYAPQEQLIVNPQYDFLRRSNVPYTNQDRTLFNDIIDFSMTSLIVAGTVGIAVASAASPGGIFFISTLGALVTFNSIPHKPDVYFYYNTSDINSLTATKVSISAGQQIGIAYLYNLTDNSPFDGPNRKEYIASRDYSINRFTFDTYAPFGNGVPASTYNSNYTPGVIALWETFSQHFGHTIANRIYGTGAGDFELQGKQWTSDFTKSSNEKYLEGFNPQIGAPADYFNWIPVGLINDLMDNEVDPPASSPVVDNVSGFTYQEIESVLYKKPSTMLEYKNSLKTIKPAQSFQIDQLFMSYGY